MHFPRDPIKARLNVLFLILLTVTIQLTITNCLHQRQRKLIRSTRVLPRPSGIIPSPCHTQDRHAGRYPIWTRLTVAAAMWMPIPWFRGYQSGRERFSTGPDRDLAYVKDTVIFNYDSRRCTGAFKNRSGKNTHNVLTVERSEWE